jgi:hypothetical protein
MAKGVPNRYTQEQLAYLEANKEMPRQELTDAFNAKFGTCYCKQVIRTLCKRKGWFTGRDGKFGKDSQPWNKGTVGVMKANSGTWTKDNNPDWNRKPIGYERLHTDGYVMVKVAEPNKFKLKHVLIWETANGPVPDKHIIRLKDGNKTNFNLDNLVCIPLGANARLNKQYKHSQADVELKPLLVTMAQIDQKIYEKENAE